jgi:hypothetical protein
MRFASFSNEQGKPTVGVSVVPNPGGLGLEDWIRTYPGWPCEPTGHPTCERVMLAVAGQPAIRFSINVMGEPSATVYFAHGGHIYAIGGNIFGSGHGGFDPTISEADFQKILNGFQVASA